MATGVTFIRLTSSKIMKRLIPKKSQWTRWSLPSKYSAIGLLIGILSILIAVLQPWLYRSDSLTATEYAKTVRWKMDLERSHDALMSMDILHDPVFNSLLVEILDELRDYTGATDSEVPLMGLILSNFAPSILITDKHIAFEHPNGSKEVHLLSTPLPNRGCNDSYSLEKRDVAGEIVEVTRDGIVFQMPTQRFTEHSHSKCDSEVVDVDYLPATAIVDGQTLSITLKQGLRLWVENGEKVIKREDITLYYVPE